MKKLLSIVTILLILIISTTALAGEWKFEKGPCVKIRITSEGRDSAIANLSALEALGALDLRSSLSGITAVNFKTASGFDPKNLPAEYIIGVVIASIKVKPNSTIVLVGMNGEPFLAFNYSHKMGELCCNGVIRDER